MMNWPGALCRPILSALSLSVFAPALVTACSAQQLSSYSWQRIQDLFVRTNPTLRAQEQSIVSNRAAEVTAGLRPNPTLQNDTTSATLGVYQEFEIGGKRTARLRSARLSSAISQTDAADTRRTLTLSLRQAFIAALQAKSDMQFAQENLTNYQRTVDINRQMLQQGEIARAVGRNRQRKSRRGCPSGASQPLARSDHRCLLSPHRKRIARPELV